MQIEVKLFARARDLAGAQSVVVELGDGARVADLRTALTAQHPALGPIAPHLHVSIGTDYASDDRALSASDAVACFPPVSGG